MRILLLFLLLFSWGLQAQQLKFPAAPLEQTITASEILAAAVPTTSNQTITPLPAPMAASDYVAVDYFGSALGADLFIKEAHTSVGLEINHADANQYGAYTYQVVLDLKCYTDYTDPTKFFTNKETFTISYDPTSVNKFQDFDAKVFPNTYKIEATVVDIFDMTGVVNKVNTLGNTCEVQVPINASAATQLNAVNTNGILYQALPQGGSSITCLQSMKKNWQIKLIASSQKVKSISQANLNGGSGNSYGGPIMISNAALQNSVNDNNSVFISWATVGAQLPNPALYELEWQYIDDYDVSISASQLNLAAKPLNQLKYDFTENSSRIITDKVNYEIPHIYKRGYLVYRVRAILPDPTDYTKKIYTLWSLGTNTGFLNTINPTAHYIYLPQPHEADRMNWNFQVSYAEEGKSKAVVSYFDGLLKNRQTITRFSSDVNKNYLLATESFFDYEGRPAVQLLPTPVFRTNSSTGAPNSYFGYIPGMTKIGTANKPFNASIYDDINNKIGSLGTGSTINKMPALNPSTNLATQYYSPNNPLLSNTTAVSNLPHIKAIPDAEGFPYIHTKYAVDDNKFVERQGGAGAELQIGSGNETKMRRVEPQSVELDQYLGTNVGDPAFYEKIITRDPNKQQSFSILNNLGKPIMTGLMGTPGANNLPMKTLDGISIANASYTTYPASILTNGKIPYYTGLGKQLSFTFDKETPINVPIGLTHVLNIKPYNYCEPATVSPPAAGTTNKPGMRVPLQYHVTLADGFTTSTYTGTHPTSSYNIATNMPAGGPVTGLVDGEIDVNYELSFTASDLNAAAATYLDELKLEGTCLQPKSAFMPEINDNCDEFSNNGANDNDDEDGECSCDNYRSQMAEQLGPEGIYGKYEIVGKSKTIVGDQRSMFKIVGWWQPVAPGSAFKFSSTTTTIVSVASDDEIICGVLPVAPFNGSTTNFWDAYPGGIPTILDASTNWNDLLDRFILKGYKPIYAYQTFLKLPPEYDYFSALSLIPASGPYGPAPIIAPTPVSIVSTNDFTLDFNTPTFELIEKWNEAIGLQFIKIHPEYCDYQRRYCDEKEGHEFTTILDNIPDATTAAALGLLTVEQMAKADPLNVVLLDRTDANYGALPLNMDLPVIPIGSGTGNNSGHPWLRTFKQKDNGLTLWPMSDSRYYPIEALCLQYLEKLDFNIAGCELQGPLPLSYLRKRRINGALSTQPSIEHLTYNKITELSTNYASVINDPAYRDIYFEKIRDMYLSNRNTVIASFRKFKKSECGGTSSNYINNRNVVETHRIFKDYLDEEENADPNSQLDPGTIPSTIPTTSTIIDDATKNYIDYIIESLDNCTIMPSSSKNKATELALLRNELIAYNPGGAKSYLSKVFVQGINAEYIKERLQAHDFNINDICNPYMFNYSLAPANQILDKTHCKSAAFYNDLTTFVSSKMASAWPTVIDYMAQDKDYKQSAALPSITISKTSTNQYEAWLADALGITSSGTINLGWYYENDGTTQPASTFMTPPSPATQSSPGSSLQYNFGVQRALPKTFNIYFAKPNDATACIISLNLKNNLIEAINGSSVVISPTNTTNIGNKFFSATCEQLPMDCYTHDFSVKYMQEKMFSTFGSPSTLFEAYSISLNAKMFMNANFDVQSPQRFTAPTISINCDPLDNIECITATEFKKAYAQFETEVVNQYKVQGLAHPAFRTVLRNYMNYTFRKFYSTDRYYNFLQGTDLASYYYLAQPYNYFQAEGNATYINGLINDIKNYTYTPGGTYTANVVTNTINANGVMQAGTPVMTTFTNTAVTLGDIPYLHYEKAGTHYLSVDCSNLLLKGNSLSGFISYLNTIATAGQSSTNVFYMNKTAEDINATQPIKLTLLTDAALTLPTVAGVTPSSVFTTTVNLFDLGLNTATLTEIQLPAASTPAEVSNYIYALDQYLDTWTGYMRRQYSHLSTMSTDNLSIEKRAYLDYAYEPAANDLTNAQLMDRFRVNALRANVPALSSSAYNYLSYCDPDYVHKRARMAYQNPYAPDPTVTTSNLYLGNKPAASSPAQNKLKDLIQSCLITLNTNNNIISTNTVYTPTIQGDVYQVRAKIIDDATYWILAKNTSSSAAVKYHNIYFTIPPFVAGTMVNNVSLDLTTLQPILNEDGDATRFVITGVLATATAGTTAPLYIYGRSDFAFAACSTKVLEDVMLCDGMTQKNKITSCVEDQIADAVNTTEAAYQDYLAKVLADIKQGFVSKFGELITQDDISVAQPTNSYAITLYNYDRAGNLMSTVPPSGVDKLTPSDIDNMYDLTKKRKPTGIDQDNATIALNYKSPAHSKVTQYTYSSLNQVTMQHTPDAGDTKFYYDEAGRLLFSQNAEQAKKFFYAYTLYDKQNRIVETGKIQAGPTTSLYTNFIAHMDLSNVGGLFDFNYQSLVDLIKILPRTEVVRTFYDQSVYDFSSSFSGLSPQENLRSRVASVMKYDHVNKNSIDPLQGMQVAMHYSYDISGNVQTLTYDMPMLGDLKQRYKRIDYDYDLYSGKVNLVSYNRGFSDQFYQKYSYDADNKITAVASSGDGFNWQTDAQYLYYHHGPLARIKLGDLQVQGVDFAYTLQGWLKTINGDAPDAINDIGGDATANSTYKKDLIKHNLYYYANDYKPIDGTDFTNTPSTKMAKVPTDNNLISLYNGNIAASLTAPGYLPSLYTAYRYDQLNRIKDADYRVVDFGSTGLGFDDIVKKFSTVNPSAVSNTIQGANADDLYKSTYTYDLDGNLQNLVRYGYKAGTTAPATTTHPMSTGAVYKMDDLTYHYNKGLSGQPSETNNQLTNYEDAVDHYAATNFNNDLQNYTSANTTNNVSAFAENRFDYDAIGNLIADRSNPKELTHIEWNLYGKIAKLTKKGIGNVNNDELMSFYYDPLGNRYAKVTTKYINSKMVRTGEYYIRDAGGNVLAVYRNRKDLHLVNPYVDIADNVVKSTTSKEIIKHIFSDQPSLQVKTIANMEIDVAGMADASKAKPISFYTSSNPTMLQEILLNATDVLPNILTSTEEGQVAMVEAALPEMHGTSKYAALIASDAVLRSNLYQAIATQYPDSKYDLLLSLGVSEIERDIDDNNFIAAMDNLRSEGLDFVNGVREFFAMNELTEQPLMARFAQVAGYLDYEAEEIVSGTMRNYFGGVLASNESNYPLLNDVLDNATDAQSFFSDNYTSGQLLTAWYQKDDMDFLTQYVAEPKAKDYLSSAMRETDDLTPYKVMLLAGTKDQQFITLPLQEVLDKDHFYLAEHNIYGSSRLGLNKYWSNHYSFTWNAADGGTINNNLSNLSTALSQSRRPWYSDYLQEMIQPGGAATATMTYNDPFRINFVRGLKHFELTNHLGNVMAVVTDKVISKPNATTPTLADKEAALAASYDYYPFGMLMPERYTETEVAQEIPVSRTVYNYVYDEINLEEISLIHTAGLNSTNTMQGGKNIVAGGPITTLFTTFGTATLANERYLMITKIKNTNNAPMTIKVEQQVNGVYITLAEEKINSSKSLSLDFITQNTNPVRGSFVQTGTGFEVEELNYAHLNKVASTDVVMISNNNPDFGEGYRFGFNGMQRDDELKGAGNSLDFGARIYDGRLGRFLSRDPNFGRYVGYSPYAYALNSPLKLVDVEGRGSKVSIDGNTITYSSVIYVIGPCAEDVALDANNAFKEFAQAQLQNLTYTDINGKVYNLVIELNYVAVSESNQAEYEKAMQSGGTGNNILSNVNYGDSRLADGYRSNACNAIGNIDKNPNGGKGNFGGDTKNGIYYNYSMAEALTAIHETFHQLGLGDRYLEKNIFYNCVTYDEQGNIIGETVVGINYEYGFIGDLMENGKNFNQEHVKNLVVAALSEQQNIIKKNENSAETGGASVDPNNFVMRNNVDQANNRGNNYKPPSKIIRNYEVPNADGSKSKIKEVLTLKPN